MTTLKEKAELLRAHFLLQRLSEPDLEQIAGAARLVRYAAHELVYSQGDSNTDLIIVISGRIKLSAVSAGGRELLVNIARAGHVLGEISVIDGQPRSYDASALEQTEVLIVHRKHLIPLLEQRPALCIHLMAGLCERLRRSEGRIQDAVFLKTGARLARQLLQLAQVYGRREENGIRLDLKISQGDLASLVGMTRESINKQLCAWRRAGVVHFGRKVYTIGDIEALRRAAE